MRAIIYKNYGPPEVLCMEDVPKPVPADNEVLIKVKASTVTSGDCNIRGFTFVPSGFKTIARLLFGIRKPKKHILGIEFSGEIEAVGKDVTLFQKGDPVFGIDGKELGSYAEYKCISQNAGLVKKPDNISYHKAAATPNGFLTALTFLKKMGRIRKGQKVLINGAAGSVGSAAVQLSNYFGADVTAVCSTANIKLVKSLGAHHVIDYTKDDFTKATKNYDIIFDTVGKSSFSGCKKILSPNGIYLAGAGGISEYFQALLTIFPGRKKIRAGVSSESAEDLEYIKKLVEAEKIEPVIDRSYPLEEIVEAHKYVDQGHKKGNVVITIDRVKN